jgi:pyruvate,water dikinase
VAEYCRRHNIDPGTIGIATIVQRMIEPELAGVAFTVNPASGDERVVIEACAGVAEELLAGRGAPLPPDHPLLEKHRASIERIALAIQRYFGAPQDVEFAIERGELYVLQSRPITRITFPPRVGVWTNADFRDGGVSSGVCSPLMWSLYELAWDRSIKGTLRELKLWDEDFVAARMFFGRPYWNLGAVKQCVAKLPGFVERDFDDDLSIQPTYDGDGERAPLTFGRLLRAIPTLLSTRRFFHRQLYLGRRLIDGGFEKMTQPYEPIADDVEGKFRQLVQGELLAIESNYFRTIFAAFLAKMDLLTTFPQAANQSLLASLPPLRHMEPVRLVQAHPDRDADRLSDIVTRFRHHYRQGLDIRFPRWDEDRQFVMQMLRDLPATDLPDTRGRYESALAEVRAQIPKRRHRSLAKKLERLRTFLWLREELRDLSSKMYYLIRRYALEIARRRRLGDDIFFMAFDELLADDRSNVERNQATYESYRNFKAPNEIGSRYGGRRSGWPSDLCGLAASAGSAEGAAYIARGVADAAGIEPGQILVCPFTDPGWTPILFRAAGVVTETGGLLSHAAVICREFGIPAVLGVQGATARIRHGQRICLDGTRGMVQIDNR